jgi:hypothetical protein
LEKSRQHTILHKVSQLESNMQTCQAILLLGLHAALGSAAITKRSPQTNSTLFAYGTNASSWPIAYGDDDGMLTGYDIATLRLLIYSIGCLYVTENPEVVSGLTPLTWDLPSITQENWIVNATFDNGTSAGSLALLPEKNYAVGVLPLTQIPKVEGVVSGFALFATQLVYNNNTMLEAQFWASPGNKSDSDAYTLVWSQGQSTEAGSFPVVIKGVENAIA